MGGKDYKLINSVFVKLYRTIRRVANDSKVKHSLDIMRSGIEGLIVKPQNIQNLTSLVTELVTQFYIGCIEKNSNNNNCEHRYVNGLSFTIGQRNHIAIDGRELYTYISNMDNTILQNLLKALILFNQDKYIQAMPPTKKWFKKKQVQPLSQEVTYNTYKVTDKGRKLLKSNNQNNQNITFPVQRKSKNTQVGTNNSENIQAIQTYGVNRQKHWYIPKCMSHTKHRYITGTEEAIQETLFQAKLAKYRANDKIEARPLTHN